MDFSDNIRKYGRGRYFLQGGVSDGTCLWNWIWGGLQGEETCIIVFSASRISFHDSTTDISAFSMTDISAFSI